MYYTLIKSFKERCWADCPLLMNDKQRKFFVRIVCIILAVLMLLGTLSVAITAFI